MLWNTRLAVRTLVVAILLFASLSHAGARQGLTSKQLYPDWVGKRFMFLPSGVGNDYEQFTVVKKPGIDAHRYETEAGLSYSKFHDAIITCTAVRPGSLLFYVPRYKLDVSYTLVTYTDESRDPDLAEVVDNVAPAGELNAVKQAYLGRTVWAKPNAQFVYYWRAAKQDIDIDRRCIAPAGDKMTVTGARWGDNPFRPVRLIATDANSGVDYCYEVAADPTNKITRQDPTPLTTAGSVLSNTALGE